MIKNEMSIRNKFGKRQIKVNNVKKDNQIVSNARNELSLETIIIRISIGYTAICQQKKVSYKKSKFDF